jgi:hypothetical protein
MIIKYLDEKKNTNTDILFKCDECGNEFIRKTKSHKKVIENTLYCKDFCQRCWRIVLNNRKEYKEKMSQSLKKRFSDPKEREKISKSSKGKINLGDKNGMKQLEARKKVSNTRKEMLKDENLRRAFSLRTKKAWEEGKYEGVKVGQCKWFDYEHSNGTIYKVQGTWELAFIKWLDEKNLKFTCHRGRIPYTLDGKEKNYYPDFWIDEWSSYVDVKAEVWYDENKFNAIRKNCDKEVKILFKEQLLELGVKI